MSAKWRALQHKHRYTYSYTAFPESFVNSLDLLPSDCTDHPSLAKFLLELRNIISLDTTYAQVVSMKNLAAFFCDIHSDVSIPKDLLLEATRLYLKILFLENSLPLHRTLISAIIKNQKYLNVIDVCLVMLCKEGRDMSRKENKWFLMSRMALSLMGYPKLIFLNNTLDKCAILIALDVVDGLMGVMSDIECGSRPSPSVMEQCQDAMSCLYYLLQRFASRFYSKEDDLSVFESILRAILSVLKSSAFSRDCLVAAGVCFWAALQVCISSQDLTSFIAQDFFGVCSEDLVKKLSTTNIPCKIDLYSDIINLSTLSRLFLLRGILTAVPRSVLNTHINESNRKIWTILYNGILPELCNYCENPVDTHFNFHALTVSQMCFQQIKTSILSGVTNFSGDFDPLPEDITNRILRIIWNNLEDPLNQTVKQVHLIFDLFLDIHTQTHLTGDSGIAKSFFCRTVSDLLCLGPCSKGRYVPLAFLTKRLGARTLLDIKPELISETVHAYTDDSVCCAATSFLKCFLECLRDECWRDDGIESGYESFRGVCLPIILEGLISGDSKLRSNLNTYALPVMLDVDVDSIFPMLAFISVGPNGEENNTNNMEIAVEQSIAVLVSLLKVSRLLALIEGDIDWEQDSTIQNGSHNSVALVCVKGVNVKVIVEWLELALSHVDECIRIDAAETLFLNPKTASLPSSLELSLMRKAVPLNMRCCSTAFQMKWRSLFKKFFSRVKTALERQVKQGSMQLVPCSLQKEEIHCLDAKVMFSQRAEDLYSFMKWLSSYLFFSCYPSAPYERKSMAMELILIMIDFWPIVSPSKENVFIYPYSSGFLSPDAASLLVSSIVDSWDRLRESSCRILLHFPTPIPGFSSYGTLKELILWAKNLVCSPRVRESDAGALTLRLIFRKYVLGLGWMVRASSNVLCFDPRHELLSENSDIVNPSVPIVDYFLSLINWLSTSIEEGERDLSKACRNSSIHGVLLTLRYTFEELDWNSTVVLSNRSGMKCVLEKLLALIMRITSLALWVVSADAWYLPDDTTDVIDESDIIPEVISGMDTLESSTEMIDGSQRPVDDVGPSNQVIMVGCWLAMKEVSLLLGTIVQKVPLPTHTITDSPNSDNLIRSADKQNFIAVDVMLGFGQLQSIGNHFLQVLFKMKHNGAIDKTRAGFTALCNRLLSSNDQRLCKMTEAWMEQLMERVIAKGQTVDDLLRRSAGIPAAFIAFFLSEPEGMPKKLLPWALRRLIDVANKSISSTSDSKAHSDVPNQEKSRSVATVADVYVKASKIRDEGLVPTVHAFNVLRAAFNDSNLAADTSGFCAEVLIISIRSFSSPYWEVRNSACLAYTALVRRMIGFLNVQKRESTRRSLTGLEFFHRYPTLHSFLLDELKIATESLADGKDSRSNMSNAIHPSLCPILILLSRLKPYLVSSGSDDAFDPFLFMPFIRRCATQSNFKVRVLASRALTGVVSNERLSYVLTEVASGLPCRPKRHGPNTDECSMPCDTTFNSIHGMLLQLSMLIDINCRNLNDVNKKGKIVEDLIQILMNCLWLGSIKLCPCPTLNSSFLQVLDHLLDISRTFKMGTNTVLVQGLLKGISSEYLDRDSLRLASYDPTEAELQRKAAVSYFSCVFEVEEYLEGQENIQQCMSSSSTSKIFKAPYTKSVIQFQEKITFSLSHHAYEVRLSVLKWLMKFLKSAKSGDAVGIIYLWAKTSLQSTLLELLTVEKSWKCVYYILNVIYFWNLLHLEENVDLKCQGMSFATTDFDPVFCFWNRLASLSCTVTHSKTRETVIRCMGVCVRHLTQYLKNSPFIHHSRDEVKSVESTVSAFSSERWTKVYRIVNVFVLLVREHSIPSEPVNMRKAAAESIVASGLLKESEYISLQVSNCEIPSEKQNERDLDDGIGGHFIPVKAINLYARSILDMWSICIQLLEDEDVDLRHTLAKDVQSYTSTKNSRQANITCNAPTQVEKVIESCFSFLSSIFGHWIEYFDYLSRWALSTASYFVAHRNLVRQVFDKEIDNHHEEKLLICQISCHHLERILTLPYWSIGFPSNHIEKGDVVVLIQLWIRKFFNQLLWFANEFEVEEKAAWIGGMGNHKDTFTSIYASLLGLYALAHCPTEAAYLPDGLSETSMLLSSDIVKLKEILRPFLRNPLIFNLYSLVLQSYEKILGLQASYIDSEPSKEFFVWKDFDPYFLLR